MSKKHKKKKNKSKELNLSPEMARDIINSALVNDAVFTRKKIVNYKIFKELQRIARGEKQ